jgi:TRAP-type mannitol/chloroaromatic compound transport system permease large subunit
MPNVRNEMREVVARLLSEHAELTNVSCQPIDAVNDYLQLLPMFRIILGDIGSSVENLGKKMKMPGALLVNGTIPVIVITEWARPTTLGALSMESRKAMVTLYSIRKDAWRRRSYCNCAYACVILVVGRIVLFRTGRFEHIIDELLSFRLFVLGTVPG